MYDEKCYELAEHFLEDMRHITENDKRKMAQAIQNACEDFLMDYEEKE